MSQPKGIASTMDAYRADYEMSRENRFIRRRTGLPAQGGGADYHYRTESQYYNDIEKARDMDRNDALAGVLADRRVDNIVQQGFKLDPKTGDKKLDDDLWQRWQDFANDPEQCDIAGEMTWHEFERHASRAESIDGDHVVIGTEDGPLQAIEAHLIQTETTTPDTFLGVTRDQYGKRTQYWIRQELNQFAQKGKAEPLDVRNEAGVRQIFHIYNPKRINQTRGVTQFAPIFSYAGMLEDINFAKLVQQQVASCFAILKEQMVTSTGPLPSADAGYGQSSVEIDAAGVRQIDGVSPGMEYTGAPGQTLKGFSPNIPNAEYFLQVKLILQVIGVNFGLPLCLVLMDGSETNFSGWRGAVDEARKGFVADQLNLVTRLHSPVYRWKLSQWIEKDRALKKVADKIGKAFFNHKWHLPTWSYIEPVADAEGDAVQLRNALTSPRRLHSARGNEWEEIADESIVDNAYAIENAKKKASELNGKYPENPVTWRDLIALPMPEGATIALQDPAVVESQKAAAEQETDGATAPTGEYAGISTQQWNRNRKAIKKILDELASGETSEQAARVFLGGLGLAQQNVDMLIIDATDGKVETPEVNEDVE